MRAGKIFGVIGSPRHNHNTGLLVQRVLDGAAEAGMSSQSFYVHDYRVGLCDACDACKQLGRCIKEDDMQIAYRALNESKALVIGTPIYFDHVSAQLKLFLDRLYPYCGPNMEKLFPAGVKAALVFTYGDADPHLYDGVAGWLRERLAFYYDIETVATLAAADTGNRPVAERRDLLLQAYKAGRQLAERVEASSLSRQDRSRG